jgi:carbohydrate-binding DOMON domain-containing protein
MAMTQDQCDHPRIEVTTFDVSTGREISRQSFNRADIQQQEMQELPDREAMSLVNANLAIPINLAAALNVLSDGSIAAAAAQQITPIDQSTGGGMPGGTGA